MVRTRLHMLLAALFLPLSACSEGPSIEVRADVRDIAEGTDVTSGTDADNPDVLPEDSLLPAEVEDAATEDADDAFTQSDTELTDLDPDGGPDSDAPDSTPGVNDSDVSSTETLDSATDTSTADLTDTFVPLTCTPRPLASGLAPGTNELMPGGTRLRAAVSTDGLTWTRLPEPIIDQAATPTLTRLPDGRPLLFMTAHKINGVRDGTAVAIGTLDGRSWTHCKVELVGFPPDVLGSDPDVVALPEGGFRLFVTGSVGAGNPPPVGIHYADSDDGLHWVYGGIALKRNTGPLIDSMTFIHDGVWHMYTLQATSIAMVHGTSTDGKSFTIASEGEVRIGVEPHVLSHATYIGFAHRIFGFGPRGETIRAFDIGAGGTLTGDSRALLSTKDGDPGDKLFVKDPAVTVLDDGSYLMVYATAL